MNEVILKLRGETLEYSHCFLLGTGKISDNQIIEFDSYYQLLQYSQEKKGKKLYFLGVENFDDLMLIEKVRKADKKSVIVLISQFYNLSSHIRDFNIEALSIVEPVETVEKIQYYVNRAVNYTFFNDSEEIEINGDILDLRDILYFETDFQHSRHIRCILRNGEKSYNARLRNIRNLHPSLMTSSISNIVNVNNIVDIDSAKGIIKFERPDKIAYLTRTYKKNIFEKIKMNSNLKDSE